MDRHGSAVEGVAKNCDRSIQRSTSLDRLGFEYRENDALAIGGKGAVVALKQPDAITEFSAAVDRQDLVKAESRSFLQRVFKGAESALLLHFAENSELTPEQARKLKQLLEEASKRKH